MNPQLPKNKKKTNKYINKQQICEVQFYHSSIQDNNSAYVKHTQNIHSSYTTTQHNLTVTKT
jgi:hypothetical protein